MRQILSAIVLLCCAISSCFAQNISFPPTLEADHVSKADYTQQAQAFDRYVNAPGTPDSLKASLVKSFILTNTDKYISLVKFGEMISSQVVDHAERRFERFPPALRETVLGKKIAEMIAISQQLQIGQTAPEIAAQTLDGQPFHLSDLRGKYVLIDFWASWCGPCRKESPALVKAYDRFKEKPFTIISFSLDKNHDAWSNAVREDHYTWPQISDLKEYQSENVKNYMVVYVPKSFLVDPSGKIIAKDLRGENIEKELEKIFLQK